jgi:putative flippase GtrA
MIDGYVLFVVVRDIVCLAGLVLFLVAGLVLFLVVRDIVLLAGLDGLVLFLVVRYRLTSDVQQLLYDDR